MRRLVLVAVIAVVIAVLPVALARSAWAGGPRATRVPVLLYHRVVAGDAQVPLEVGAESFTRQMAYMRLRGYHFATMKELEAYVAGHGHLPDPTAMVTFDDGYADNYTVAFPIMRQYGVHATVFVITSLVGTPGYLTAAQIAEMSASGVVEFQLHTDALHVKTDDGQSAVLAVPQGALVSDLATAKAKLALWTGRNPDAFAYPFGFYNEAVASPLNAAGVKVAFTVEPGYVRPGDNPYQLHRMPVFGTLRQRYLFRFIGGLEGLSFK